MLKIKTFVYFLGFTILGCSNPTPVQTSTPIEKEVPIEVESNIPQYHSKAEFTIKGSNSFNMPNGAKSQYFAVYVKNFDSKDENVWNDMSTYANNYVCESKGFLGLWFFDNEYVVFKTNNNLEWDEKYDKNCVAAKWCFPNGKTEMKRFPMN